MHIHSVSPDERRLDIVLVIRGENYDSLLTTARPKPVCEVEQTRQRHAAIVLIIRKFDRLSALRSSGCRNRHDGRPRCSEIDRAIDVFYDDDGFVRRLDKSSQRSREASKWF